jgi:hypothetical protein
MPSVTSTICRTLDSVLVKKPASAGFFMPTI